MKKLYILFLFIVLSLNGYAQSDTTVTNTAANTSFLDFVKKVYFNPTILLKTQNFKAANNVQIQLLPSNSSQSPQSIKGFELAMQKVIRFILESGSEGIVRYYFNPNFPSTPFSVVYSEELHCKFTSADIDSITNRLNAPFKNTAINYNNSALFEGAIQAGMDYTAQCLRKNPGKCGKKPENLISEINTKPLYITLHNTNGSKYDIDTFRYENYDSYYTQVYDLFTQQNAYVPAKLFVAGGASEPISIAIHKREENVLKQNFKVVYIATKQILELESGSSTDSLKIKLPQNLPANQIAEFGIYYKSTQDSITYLVGSFMVHVYTEKVINLHLVSVDGAAIPQQDIAAALKKMYDPVGVKFNISATKNITANPSWAKDITIESSGLLSSYTKDLKDYVGAVKDLDNYDKEEYYMVFGLNCNNGITGYMPRKSNIGFVFTNTADAGDVLAHEIGHGAFHLRHIFSDEELGASMQGMTKNLMDYVQNPTDLYVPQWEGIDDPVSVGWFEGDDEEGASTIYTIEQLYPFKNENSNSYTFLTPAGKIISIPGNGLTNVIFYEGGIHENTSINQTFQLPVGSLAGFELNGNEYVSTTIETNFFSGYRTRDKSIYYIDSISKKISENERKVIYAYPCYEGACLEFGSGGGGILLETNSLILKLKITAVSVPSSLPWIDKNTVYQAMQPEPLDRNHDFLNTLLQKGSSSSETRIIKEFYTSLKQDALNFLKLNITCGGQNKFNSVFQIINFINNDKQNIFDNYLRCGGGEYIHHPDLDQCFQNFVATACSTCVSTPYTYEVYESKLASLYNGLTNYISKTQTVNATIESWSGTASGLSDYLNNHLCKKESYSILSADSRVKILKVLGGQSIITDCWYDPVQNCSEGQIIMTIKYANPSDYEAVLNELKNNNYELFYKFYDKIDNHGLGYENFDAFINALTTIILNKYSFTDFESHINQNNVFTHISNPFNSSTTSYMEYVDRKFLFDIGESTRRVEIKRVDVTFSLGGGSITEVGDSKTKFEPFELVVIYARDEYNRDNLHFNADELYVLPAFMFPAMQESQRCKLLAKNISVTVGTVFAGVSIGATAAASPLVILLGFTDAIGATYVMCANEGSLLSELNTTYGKNSWQYTLAEATNSFFKYYLLARTGHAAYSMLKPTALKFSKFSQAQMEWFQTRYPDFYTKIQKIKNAINGNSIVVNGAGRTLSEMRNSVDEWVRLQRQLTTSNNQLREFNTATILYNKATGKYYYGANKGIAVSGSEIHPTLAAKLPETSTNSYKLGNCAECDAVNQALHDGANWSDLQMHTVGVQWNTGATFPKPLCSNCEITFEGIEILQ